MPQIQRRLESHRISKSDVRVTFGGNHAARLPCYTRPYLRHTRGNVTIRQTLSSKAQSPIGIILAPHVCGCIRACWIRTIVCFDGSDSRTLKIPLISQVLGSVGSTVMFCLYVYLRILRILRIIVGIRSTRSPAGGGVLDVK